jgi:hypothetical protein
LSQYNNPQFEQAVVAKLTEHVLGSTLGDNISQMRDKSPKLEHDRKTS